MGCSNSKNQTAPEDGGGSGGSGKVDKKYKFQEELGSGAFSVVRRVVDRRTREEFACKIVTKNKLTQEDLDAVQAEISIMRELDHPHIIRMVEDAEDNTNIYIVLELVRGGELFDRIVAKTAYTEKEARDLVKLLLETLDYLHTNDVVHRDLKPENLLLTSEDDDANVKIADFGFAKHVSELQEKEVACGTPGYVAPEILSGRAYTAEVDIWSMGVICYILLGGYPPFYDDDNNNLFRKIKAGKFEFHEEYWNHISVDAKDLIEKMLVVNQADRWTAGQLLRHKWITGSDEELASRNITDTLVELKRYNARRKFKAGVDAVLVMNRLTKTLDIG